MDVMTLAPSTVSVVMASVWMVDAVRLLASRRHVSHMVLGVLVLSTLTSVPNVVAAIHLARAGRGARLSPKRSRATA
jgi:Ca2+/Na+ antiporter